MILRDYLAVLTIVGASSVTAHAGMIIQYGTEEVGSGPPTPTVTSVAALNTGPGVTGIAVTRGAGLTPVSASFAINSSGWNTLAANDFYQFGFTTTIPYAVSELTVGLRSSATGPGFVDLLYSKDGGAFTSLTPPNPIELIGTNFNNLDTSLAGIGVVQSSLIFELVVDPGHPTNAQFNMDPTLPSAIGSGGTFRFASFSTPAGVFVDPAITGQAVQAAVPEPASLTLLGLGGMALVLGAKASRRRASAA
jgi:hypothetical protein